MSGSYDAVWHEPDKDCSGHLVIGSTSLRLVGIGGEPEVQCELGFDEVHAVAIRPSPAAAGGALVVLEHGEGGRVEIELRADSPLSVDLVERVFVHGLGSGRGKDRLLFAVELKPGSREAALTLLRAGPPFDPYDTALVAHDAFLLDDEVIFFFETDDLEALALQVEGFWQSRTPWRELMTGNVRLAEHAYTWTRRSSTPSEAVRVGLGL